MNTANEMIGMFIFASYVACYCFNVWVWLNETKPKD